MAKSKPVNDPTIQSPDADLQGDAGDELQTLDLADEIANLRAELAAKTAEADKNAQAAKELETLRDKSDELDRLLAQAKAGPLPAAPIDFDGPKKRFVVAVPDAPTWCVEAPHESLAFDAYRKASGMISTPHQPSVVAVSIKHPLGKAPFPFPGPGDGLPE